jgi:hypothetical protein
MIVERRVGVLLSVRSTVCALSLIASAIALVATATGCDGDNTRSIGQALEGTAAGGVSLDNVSRVEPSVQQDNTPTRVRVASVPATLEPGGEGLHSSADERTITRKESR